MPPDRGDKAQSSRTAHRPNKPSGWTEITHPFHPLRGQRFPVLNKRRVSGIDGLILRGTTGGTFYVPREWTDRDDPPAWADLPVGPQVLDIVKLVALAELLAAVEQPRDGGLHK